MASVGVQGYKGGCVQLRGGILGSNLLSVKGLKINLYGALDLLP